MVSLSNTYSWVDLLLTFLLLGIRAYAARNHMRNMNAGDKAFFYHSNCKEPGIAGVMEIVKEFSEDSRSLSLASIYSPFFTNKSKRLFVNN